MGIIRNSRLSVKKILKTAVSQQTGWYAEADFYKALKKERNRSNRTGLPISFILMDLSNSTPEAFQLSDNEYQNFLEKLIHFISDHTREYDVKYLINPYKIGILLIDTSLDGAKAFIEKISQTLYQHFEALNKREYIQLIKTISLSSYPLERVTDFDAVKATPVIIRCLEFEENLQKEFTKLEHRMRSEFHMDWSIVPSSNGTIALTLPIFGDIFWENQRQLRYRLFKRSFDVATAVLNIILFLPLMILIGIAVKLTSRGPVFFKQTRLGQFGRPFTFYKFRTMRVNSDSRIHQEYIKQLINDQNGQSNQGSQDEPLFKLKNDPRITRIGKFLRKTSLDELPQFFNVLKGDMSMVGPRPPIPYEVEMYKSWHLRRILEAKPGITGLWQVRGRSKTGFDDMVRLDLQYVEKQSILLDIRLVLETVPSMLNSKGAL